MDQGTFLNLFEVHLPEAAIPLMAKLWSDRDTPLDDLRRQVKPASLYASEETGKVYAYGPGAHSTSQLGFSVEEYLPEADPRLTGRLIIESVSHHLTSAHGFELESRSTSSRVCELTDRSKPLKRVEGRLDVFQSYRIQPVFLRIGDQLRHFVMVNPKVRYQFVHSLQQIQQRVDCTGRFVSLACPAACNVYDCELYELRGRLAGKIAEFADHSTFGCRFAPVGSTGRQFVMLDSRSRFDFAIPVEICALEASTSNINAVFTGRFNSAKASAILSDLRVLSGELLPSGARAAINTEVGQKRWQDIKSLLKRLDGEIPMFDNARFRVEQEPVRTVEGGGMPDESYFEHEAEDVEDTADDDGDNAF